MRERRADELLLSLLSKIPTPLLLLGDREGIVEAKLRAQGQELKSWCRWRSRSLNPPEGPFEMVLLRLPKERASLKMLLQMAQSTLSPSGRLWVYGHNDEGIRSTKSSLKDRFLEFQTVETRWHCRVWEARHPLPHIWKPEALFQAQTLQLPGDETPRPWYSAPGLFAKGRLDPATALLLETPAPRGSRFLDFGCGTGPIGAWLKQRRSEAEVLMMEADLLALEAARRNLPELQALRTQGPKEIPGRFNAIWSNPPLHRGKAEDYGVLKALIDEAPKHLRSGGELRLVVQGRVPLKPWLEERFKRVEKIKQNSRFGVWRAN